ELLLDRLPLAGVVVAGQRGRPGREGLAGHLHPDGRLPLQIAVPEGMLGGAGVRGDHQDAVAGRTYIIGLVRSCPLRRPTVVSRRSGRSGKPPAARNCSISSRLWASMSSGIVMRPIMRSPRPDIVLAPDTGTVRLTMTRRENPYLTLSVTTIGLGLNLRAS